MTAEACYPFGSAPWRGLLHGYLLAKADEFAATLEGRDFSLCEVYTDVPVDVDPADRVAVTWGFRGGRLWFAPEERDEVDIKVVIDWATVAPLARLAVAGDEEVQARMNEALGRAAASGKLAVTQRVPMPSFVATMHDDLAGVTG